MVKWELFKWLFKQEFAVCNNTIIQNTQKCDNKINKMKAELEIKKKQYGLVQRIFYLFPNAKIIGIDTNKNKEELLVVENMINSELTIYLFGPSYQGITHLPRIMSTIKKKEIKEILVNYVHIDDIINEDNAIGNGSILMKYFLKTVEELHVDYISGELSSVDKNHFDRSEHFYKKFGFEVHINEERTNGGIKKKM